MKTLIIAEKLNVACKIGAGGHRVLGEFKLSNGQTLTPAYLAKNEKMVNGIVSKMGKLENDKYIIMFASGHLVELYQAKDYDPKFKNWREIPFPYIPKPFKMKVKKESMPLFNSLKSVMNSNEVKEIIVATDADREGANIYRCIEIMAKTNKPTKRIWTGAFTESGLEKAFKQIKDNKEYRGMENAGYGRMTSDFLMGALLTAKATIDLGYGKDIINVGRVQTAVLAEIVRVENLIKNFSKQKSYQMVGKFKTSKGEVYEGVYEEKFDSLDKVKKAIERLSGTNGEILECIRDKENKWCPPLFDQTSLAIELSNKYNMTPDQTLKASQTLYEKGYQTYPRTSSRYITDGDAGDFSKMLSAINRLNPLSLRHKFNPTNKRIVDNAKVESHTAIVPTESVPDLSSLTLQEKQTYTEVMLRAIAITFPAAVDEKHSLNTMVKDIPFRSTGKIELERGFREVYNLEVKDNPLPLLNKGEQVQVIGLSYREVETKPPKRYTNATILRFMETCGKQIEDEEARELMKNKGIGTPATRAEVINKLFGTKYVELKGKSIYPTEKGMKMIEIFPCDELKNPEFTGNLEFKLYEVEKGNISLEEYMAFIEEVYINACKKIGLNKDKKVSKVDSQEGLGICPNCGKGQIVHRKGKSAKGAYDFYACTNWKEGCKFTISEILQKKLTEKQVQQLLEKGETAPIKGFKKKDGSLLPSAKLIIKDKKVEINWNY